MSRIAPGPFKEAFEDIVDEVVILSHHVTAKYNAFKSFCKQSET